MKSPFDYVKCQLECGHLVVFHVEHPAKVPPEWIRCDECKADVALWAVECRENYAKCPSCRFARYTGESLQMATETKNRHWVTKNHMMLVRYTIHPGKFEELKKVYGRSVRFRVEKRVDVDWPRVKNRDDDGVIPF